MTCDVDLPNWKDWLIEISKILPTSYYQSTLCCNPDNERLHVDLLSAMNDSMNIDMNEPRGIKRTATEAGLPPEAPRRIQACICNKVGYNSC
jgi:hypothetical protein